MMSSTDSLSRASESFQRLEDFSSHTSCIKCFGKPIIPPLLTIEQREEIYRFRSAALKIEADNANKRKELSCLSNNVKETYSRDEECLADCNNDDFDSYYETLQHDSSALHVSKVMTFNTCPITDSTLISNEMHMTTSKIPSGDICSTVHKDVIVFPNVINTNNDERDASTIDAKFPMSNTDQSDVALPDYYLYQMEDHPDSLVSTKMPTEVTHTVQMHSVSEDEHDSITESTEFESLPTVINARKSISQDTDNESNATCLSQSTDLEKYMDSSIEYSSPDDITTLAQSQISSQLNMSTRSDDASSETLVNTESELTPCASAMAMLYCVDEAHNVDGKSPNTKIPYVPQRAHSVDSYVKMLKACAKKLPIRKTLSEPSNSDSKQHPIANISSQGSNLPNTVIVDETKEEMGDSQNEITPVSDSEICITFGSKTELKKSLKRKHVRTNSYTLDHPSPALIMAHADCNCNADSPDFPPHSCSLDKKSVSPPNPAFKKEKVNIVLPPTTERDKFFPFLSAMCLSSNKAGSDKIEESKILTSDVLAETEILLPEAASSNPYENEIVAESDGILPASIDVKQVQNSGENSNTESLEDNNEIVNVFDKKPQEVKDTRVSSVESSELKNSDIKELLEGVIRDVKEIQKNRVNQFLEEQNKLWFKMQEEFKEQERLLCEKLNIVNISSFSDGAHPMSYQFSDVDIKNCSVIENNLHNLNSNSISYSNAYSDVEENCFTLQTSNNKTLGVVASEQLSNQTSAHSHSSKSVSDITSSNFKATELSHNSIDSSQSATSFQSSANTREESGSSSWQLGLPSSLSIDTNDSLPSNSTDDHVRSISCQSNLSAEPLNNAGRHFKNHKLDVLSDRSDSISIRSETSVDSHFKGSEVSMDNSQNRSGSGTVVQSMYRNALSVANGLETNFSSTSYKSSSDISQYLDMTKIYSESQFLNVNNCPECILLSPTCTCDDTADQEHTESRSVCPDCQSCLQYCSKHIFQENLPSDDERHYTTPISPVEFPTYPSFSQEKKATSMGADSLLSQETEFITSKMSFKNGNMDTLDSKVSEINSATEQHSLLNNNLRPNMHSCQNTLVINTKNNLVEVNGIEDERYRENEIRAINDLVQSSYTKSYSCQLNEDYCGALIATNNLSKNPSHLQNSQSLYQIPANDLSNDEKGASKKISTTSLTNLKRRQSRDIIKDPILLKRFEKLPALVKGYLTRRLFKTERVQDLIKTLQDTAVLLGNLSQELNLKGKSVSETDVDLHRQLIVQLMTSFESLYDIFCTLSIKEQMEIISESRNFRKKKKAMEKTHSTAPIVTEKFSSSPNKKPKLSAATLKALERKRVQSIASSSKSHSPTRIYKSSSGTSMKRKTTSVRKSSPWK